MNNRLVIVTGASGALGHCYVQHFLSEENTTCVAMARSRLETQASYYQINLLNREDSAQIIYGLDFTLFSDVILIHAVGQFKYEGSDGIPDVDFDQDGIDDEVLASNYDTFVNIAAPIVEKITQQHQKGREMTLALCAFGSITDKYKLPFWQSYTHSKNVLRRFIQDTIKSSPLEGRVRGRFINVSTTNTGNENKLRPFATEIDRKFWLQPEKIVSESMQPIECLHPLWQEIDMYEAIPGFDPKDYFCNHEKIKAKWERQMGTIN